MLKIESDGEYVYITDISDTMDILMPVDLSDYKPEPKIFERVKISIYVFLGMNGINSLRELKHIPQDEILY
jgi:hypothetical protein